MCDVVQGCAEGCVRPHRAFRNDNELTALPESFGQLTALVKLDLSQRSACAKVWRGPCAAVGMVRGAEWGSRQTRESVSCPGARCAELCQIDLFFLASCSVLTIVFS